MRCRFRNCTNPIPGTRKRTARYCSEACSYAARLERSRQRYYTIKAPLDELKRSENILAYAKSLIDLKKSVTATDLQSLGFNFGISSSEQLMDRKRMLKVIGNYGYFINPDQTVDVWKLKAVQ